MSAYEKGYSPDFQEAYDRAIYERVKDFKVFNEWVEDFEDWININRDRGEHLLPSKSQIRALGYNASEEGLETSVRVVIRDKRMKEGYRIGYRDIQTGHFAKNPYRELEENKE